jgi:hypothetical protein
LLSIRRKGRESRGEQAGFPAMYAAVSTRSLRAAKPGEARARKERDARIGKNRPSGLLARHMEIGLDQQQQQQERGARTSARPREYSPAARRIALGLRIRS